MVRLVTFGSLGVADSGFARPKPLLLLTYLHLAGPQARRRLAALFWPRSRDPLNQLSLTLSRLAKAVPGAFVATHATVAAQASCDVDEFRAALEAGEVDRAADLHRDGFLAGLSVRGVSAELLEWVDDTRDALAASLQRGLLARAGASAARGRPAEAAALVRRALAVRDASLLDVDDLLLAHDVLWTAKDPAARKLRTDVEDLGLEVGRSPGAARSAADARRAGQPSAAPGAGSAADEPRAWAGGPRLVGRRRERELLRRLLVAEGARLVTITGLGGMGKSSLARAVADDLAHDAFPSGVAYLSCDDLPGTADVFRALLEALGAPLPPAGAEQGHVAQALAGCGRALVVLDDFDRHLPGAGWLGGLMSAAPHAAFLLTAHQPLGWVSEHVLPLSGLTSHGPRGGEVGELFLAGARRADATFELTEADVPHLVELGRLTGGNPLALELASSWVTVMPVAEIVAEVSKGVEILETEAQDVAPRHRSILAVFGRSWELLGEAERGRMMRLSVLRGSFDRATAASVAEVDLRDLAGLCRKSLLVRPAPGLFECPPVLRRWVRARAEVRRGDLARVRERHAAHFLGVARAAARAFDTPDGGRWLERLDREHRDLLAAIEWSWESGNAPRTLALLRALGQYWVRRSRLDAVLPWYEQVAASDPAPGTEEDLAAVLRQHAFALVLEGDLEGPRPLLQRALQLARSVASRQEEARVANALGVLAVFRQELDAGTEWYQRASALAAEAGVDDLVPFVLNNLGDVHLFRGRLEQAAACYREAVSRLRALGNLQMLSNVLGSLGLVTVREGDLPSAEAALRESLTIVRDLGITISVHPALEQYAALATAAGDASVAGRLWGAADALRNRLGLEPEWFAAEERARWQAEATRLVGAEALGAFVTSGAELSLDAAVELALVEGRRLARGAVRGARRGAARSSPAPAAPGE